MAQLSHIDENAKAVMVDTTEKPSTHRQAVVDGFVTISNHIDLTTIDSAAEEICRVGRIAAIQAAKQTPSLIPFCHSVPLSHIDPKITWSREKRRFDIIVTTKTRAETGIEVEGFVATCIGATAIYDMIKALDPGATIGTISMREKLGGKQDFHRKGSFS